MAIPPHVTSARIASRADFERHMALRLQDLAANSIGATVKIRPTLAEVMLYGPEGNVSVQLRQDSPPPENRGFWEGFYRDMKTETPVGRGLTTCLSLAIPKLELLDLGIQVLGLLTALIGHLTGNSALIGPGVFVATYDLLRPIIEKILSILFGN